MLSLTVTQIGSHLRGLLEMDPILTDIWVSGEISNLSRPQSGHIYFTLKDEAAQLRCALFRPRQTIASLTAVDHGAQVLAHGYVSFYEQRGDLQLYVDAVQPAGLGVLAAEFERLRARLEAEGLFALERKRALPLFPRRIGVVTSSTGAVFQDICHVLTRRWPLVEVLLAPTLVQGDGAATGVVLALERLNRRNDVDVIVLARGGGSMEDLWAFNEEAVARAIFASRVPVVSAVGHETDYTIADWVADVRAPTPSAAAELLVPDQLEIAARLGGREQQLRAGMRRALDRLQQDVEQALRLLDRYRPDASRLGAGVRALLETMRRRLTHELEMRQQRLAGRMNELGALSPSGTLTRGYALVHRADGELIVRAAEAHAGDSIRVRMVDDDFGARVEGGDGADRGNGATRQTRPRPVPAGQERLL
ncbi:MAG TPA: exodeoxyribonuclease VII large subunit [Dehalococcoidia bacterium]|nr:exodeoxyribonuclease VII large subunit [Dehalococcoidia bacterium]